MSKHTLNTVI